MMKLCLVKLYEEYREFLYPEVKNILEEHLLLQVENLKNGETEKHENNNIGNNTNNGSNGKKLTYDEIIHKYLEEVAEKANKAYFQFACSFSILFRESYNYQKKKDNPELKQDYSHFNGAEELPDTCNDFIIEFMDKNNYFNLDQNEIIEIIQHFCAWLFDNGHTFQMLTLC